MEEKRKILADLIKKRGYVRTSLTKSFTKLSTSLQVDDIDDANAGFAVCSSLWDNVNGYDKEIFDLLVELESSDADLEKETDFCFKYFHKLQSMK